MALGDGVPRRPSLRAPCWAPAPLRRGRARSLSGRRGHEAALRRALACGLMEASQELDEVRAALRDGGVYLGLKGPRLQRYALEVAKKEHLLRLALSAPRRRGSASVPPSWAQPLEASELVRERRMCQGLGGPGTAGFEQGATFGHLVHQQTRLLQPESTPAL